MSNKKQIKCMYCNSKSAIKKGVRKTKISIIQKYYCRGCRKYFAEKHDNKQYPIQTILNSLSNYNLGYTLNQTKQKMETQHKTKIPISTISSWVSHYNPLCTNAK